MIQLIFLGLSAIVNDRRGEDAALGFLGNQLGSLASDVAAVVLPPSQLLASFDSYMNTDDAIQGNALDKAAKQQQRLEERDALRKQAAEQLKAARVAEEGRLGEAREASGRGAGAANTSVQSEAVRGVSYQRDKFGTYKVTMSDGSTRDVFSVNDVTALMKSDVRRERLPTHESQIEDYLRVANASVANYKPVEDSPAAVSGEVPGVLDIVEAAFDGAVEGFNNRANEIGSYLGPQLYIGVNNGFSETDIGQFLTAVGDYDYAGAASNVLGFGKYLLEQPATSYLDNLQTSYNAVTDGVSEGIDAAIDYYNNNDALTIANDAGNIVGGGVVDLGLGGGASIALKGATKVAISGIRATAAAGVNTTRVVVSAGANATRAAATASANAVRSLDLGPALDTQFQKLGMLNPAPRLNVIPEGGRGVVSSISRVDLDGFVGQGAEKTIFSLKRNDKLVVALHNDNFVLSSQRIGYLSPIAKQAEIDAFKLSRMTDEVNALNQLKSQGLPVIKNYGVIDIDGEPGILLQNIPGAISSKAHLFGQKLELQNALNSRSASELKAIRQNLIDKKIDVGDAQFLIGKKGEVLFNDPIDFTIGRGPSQETLRTIDELINWSKKR